jgi:hypothetical protein
MCVRIGRTGVDTPSVFKFVEHTLDLVTLLVQGTVMVDRCLVVGF